jgi:hypothetical protein
MIDAILAKVFGTKNEREIKALLPTIAAINELEPQMQQLSARRTSGSSSTASNTGLGIRCVSRRAQFRPSRWNKPPV